MKLLIADDSSLMRERIKNQVRGFDAVTIVGEAESGETALEMISEFDPDLIMLDLRMPGMGGMEVLRNLKSNHRKTKVCVLTNYSYPQYRDRCLALGADYFLSKSEDFDKINIVIANLMKEAGTT